MDDAEITRYVADKKNKEADIIAPFVYRDYGDDELIPCWTFIGPIMNYYGINEETVWTFCREYGHKIWSIRGSVITPKIIVAAKEIDGNDILNDYGNFVDGYRDATVEEIEL